jgi:hypothetical protein
MKNTLFFLATLCPFFISAQITTGSFAARVDFTSTIADEAQNLAVSDLDGDGKQEVTVIYAGPVQVYFNTSTVGVINAATFSSTVTTLLTSGASWQGQTADLDGDGKKDVVASKWDSSPYGFSVFRNTSTVGNLSFAAEQVFDNGLANSKGLQLQDIDGDGKADIVACDDQFSKIVIMRNTSTVGTISFAAAFTITFNNYVRKLAVDDIDGDGKKDLVIGYEGLGKVAIYQNTSTVGNLSFMPKVDIAMPGEPYDVSLVDMDGDGHKDIVAACRWIAEDLSVVRSLISSPGTITTGSFAAPVNFSTGTSGCDPFGIAVGLIDNDSKPDIVVTNNFANSIAVFRNTSIVGSFTTGSLAAHVDFTTALNPDGVVLADIDGDSKNEILVACLNGINFGILSVFHNLILPLSVPESENVSVLQVYPNPANENANLSFKLKEWQQVKISLFDLSGREVGILADENMPAGEHLVKISRNDLSPGVYFVRIDAGDKENIVKLFFK